MMLGQLHIGLREMAGYFGKEAMVPVHQGKKTCLNQCIS